MKYNKNEVTGKMRDRIILQNVTRSRSLTGFASESWNDISTLWAYVDTKISRSNETIIDGKNTAKNVIDFTIRYNSSITEESRIIFENKVYQVKNITVSHDRRFITFTGFFYDSYATVLGLQLCSAALSAQSSLSASLMRAVNFSSSLSAFGSLSADINFVQKLQSSLTASASVTASPLITKLPTASLTAIGTTSATLTVTASGDADVVAYFSRVTTAGGTLSATEQSAINTLVTDLKGYGIWNKMKAIYPMVGASAAACAQNLKSSSFTGTFTSGWTFASTGATPNGTSAYMNTGLNASTQLTVSSNNITIYSRTNNSKNSYEYSAYASTTSGVYASIRWNDGNLYAVSAKESAPNGIIIINSNSTGFHQVNRQSNTSFKVFRNSATLATNTNSNTGTMPNLNIYLATFNFNGSFGNYSNRELAFASIGDGLTDAEAANFYTAVQAFQTTLNRQV